MSNPPDDERHLIQQAQAGELGAFDHVVLRHQQEVYAVALRMLGRADEAEEVAQEAFVRAYQAIRTFRQDAKLSTWLVAITMNLCRNRRRWWARRRRMIVASLDDPVGTGETTLGETVPDPLPTPERAAERREIQERVTSGLNQLDEASRAVVVLRDIQGYSYEEIAAILRLPVGTVKSRINRARVQLRAMLDGMLR